MILTLGLWEGEAVVWLPGHSLTSGNDPLGKGSGVLLSSPPGNVEALVVGGWSGSEGPHEQ